MLPLPLIFPAFIDNPSRSVHILHPPSICLLCERGCFGKGSLSRSDPTWLERTARLPDSHLTLEEITQKRREERLKFKLEREQKELEERNRILLQEGKSTKSPENFIPLPSRNFSRPRTDDIQNLEHLQLTFQEAYFLSFGLGVLSIVSPQNTPIPLNDLLSKFRFSKDPDDPFIINYVVYHHYRSLGWVVKTGSKFSADYLLYKRGPAYSHAEFAVIIVPTYLDESRNRQRPWYWLQNINRVCSQVKKTVVLCWVQIPHKVCGSPTQILSSYSIRETSIRRWQPGRNRD